MILLKEVYNSYQQKQFKKALSQFKQAKITQEQSGVAKQLKAEIINQLALEYFHEHKYKDCIEMLQSNFAVQAKPDFPIPVERTKAIIGMCYLHLSDFAKASEYLKICNLNEDTKPLYYYYLLSEIYLGKYAAYKDFKQFISEFTEFLRSIPSEKLMFLEAVFYLLKGEDSKFTKLMSKIDPVSTTQQVNFAFLSGINKIKKKTEHVTSLKPLYKLINNTPLSVDEKLYLHSIPGLDSYLRKNENSKSNKVLFQEVEKLCSAEKPLDEIQFNEALEHFTGEVKNKIIFNQISAIIAYSDESIGMSEFKTKNIKVLYLFIENVIKKHRLVFFSFPESIYSYLSFISRGLLSDAVGFFENIFFYIEKHRYIISDYMFEKICLESISLCNRNFPSFKADVYISKFQKIKPNLMGLLMYNAHTYISGNTKIIPDIHLTLTSPHINDLGIDEFTRYFSMYHSLLKDSFDDDEVIILERIRNFFFKILNQEIPLSLSNKAILRLHVLLNDFLAEDYIENDYSSDSKYLDYLFHYQKRLEFFKENKENSLLFESYFFVDFCVKNHTIKRKFLHGNYDGLNSFITAIVNRQQEILLLNVALKLNNSDSDFSEYNQYREFKNLLFEIFKVLFAINNKDSIRKFSKYLHKKFDAAPSYFFKLKYFVNRFIDNSGSKHKVLILRIIITLLETSESEKVWKEYIHEIMRFINKFSPSEMPGEEELLFIIKMIEQTKYHFEKSKTNSERQLYNKTVERYFPDFSQLELLVSKTKTKKKKSENGYWTPKLF